MSAPSRTHSVRTTTALLVMLVAAALIASSCALPGAGRLRQPPEGLHPAFESMPADVISFTLLDTDRGSARWAKLDQGVEGNPSTQVLRAFEARLLGAETRDAAMASWAGPVAGTVWRIVDTDRSDGSATFAFSSVRRRGDLERTLRTADFERASSKPTLDAGTKQFSIWEAPAAARATLPVLAVGDDIVFAAASIPALRTILARGDRAPVAKRDALSSKIVDSMEATPLAVVVRPDVVRNQAKRPFQDDPAQLELATWATAAPIFTALREGWVGVAPPIDDERPSLRLVGKFDWVGQLVEPYEPGEVDRSVLDAMPANIATAVALDDLGAILERLLRNISGNGIDFATEQDVPKGADRVELLPLLDRIDGDASLGYLADPRAVEARLETSGDEELGDDVREALAIAGLKATVDEYDGRLALHGGDQSDSAQPATTDRLGDLAAYRDAMEAAGRPPKQPVAWLWNRGAGCAGPTAGWLTWDGGPKFTVSADIAVPDRAGCEPAADMTALLAPWDFPVIR